MPMAYVIQEKVLLPVQAIAEQQLHLPATTIKFAIVMKIIPRVREIAEEVPPPPPVAIVCVVDQKHRQHARLIAAPHARRVIIGTPLPICVKFLPPQPVPLVSTGIPPRIPAKHLPPPRTFAAIAYAIRAKPPLFVRPIAEEVLRLLQPAVIMCVVVLKHRQHVRWIVGRLPPRRLQVPRPPAHLVNTGMFLPAVLQDIVSQPAQLIVLQARYGILPLTCVNLPRRAQASLRHS